MTTISHSRRLRQKIELFLPELAEASAALADHPRIRALYPELVVNTHHGMRASAALLRTAAHRCRDLADSDPVAAALEPYYAQHALEEDHDHWALEDLEVIGIPRADVLRRMPPPTVASMAGAQYYWVLHHHPVALLGDVMVREGYVPTVEAVDVLVARTGYPRAAFRNLERHAHVDLKHGDDVIEQLDGLPLREEHHTILGVSALHTLQMSTQMLRELLDWADALPAAEDQAYVLATS